MTIKYDNGMDKGTVAYIALRESPCNGTVTDRETGEKHDCPFQARYMVLGHHGVSGFCGIHVRDEWLPKIHNPDLEPPGRRAWDGRRTRCDADVTARSALEGQDIRCRYNAAVVIYRTEEGKEFAACKHHAFSSWLADLEQDDEDEADAEAEKAEVPA